jgi:hypothetical protein
MVEPGESAAIVNSIVPPAERAPEGRMHVSVGDGSTAELQDGQRTRQELPSHLPPISSVRKCGGVLMRHGLPHC